MQTPDKHLYRKVSGTANSLTRLNFQLQVSSTETSDSDDKAFVDAHQSWTELQNRAAHSLRPELNQE